jgi:hypothetical protein
MQKNTFFWTVRLVTISAFLFYFPIPSVKAQAVPNPDCTLIVPPNPLSANGLATPYQLVATDPDPAKGVCSQKVKQQQAFVQGAIFDPATGQISIYNPLVIDKTDNPNPPKAVVPRLPKDAIVALWFGYNGGNLSLSGPDLKNANCVNGGPTDGDRFMQFAYCNAPDFFKAANMAIFKGRLVVPRLGIGADRKTCPSVRSFTVVDQDQSDNVTTTYLQTPAGEIVQDTAANQAAFPGSTQIFNASDNRLVAVAINNALKCQAWKVPDLADPGKLASGLPLNELQARSYQKRPVALVPAGNPMVLLNGKPNLNKLNAYRVGVDQPKAFSFRFADTKRYCRNLFRIAPQRFILDKPLTVVAPSPDPAAANSLFTFLAQRFVGADKALNCAGLLNVQNPVTVITDGNGVAIDATIAPAINKKNVEMMKQFQAEDDKFEVEQQAETKNQKLQEIDLPQSQDAEKNIDLNPNPADDANPSTPSEANPKLKW